MADFKHFDERDDLFRNSKGKVKAAPSLPAGTLVADTHCHLGMLADPALALARAAAHGVDFICCMTDPSERPDDGEDVSRLSARATYDALDGWIGEAASLLELWGMAQAIMPRVRYACGVHPHNAKHWERARDELMALLERPETCCLGEIGLDYHYDFSPRDTQRAVFAEQLRIACELNLPVSLHLREAHDEALDILHDVGIPQAGCILHCFNLDRTTLAPFLELGCHIAFGGPLTFKKSWETRRAALDVPANRLLTETDAPYMAPEPLRGTVCTPDMTVFTLRTLLDCFGYAGDEVAEKLIRPRPGDAAGDAGRVQRGPCANDGSAGEIADGAGRANDGSAGEIADGAGRASDGSAGGAPFAQGTPLADGAPFAQGTPSRRPVDLSEAAFAEQVFQNALDLLDVERA